MGLRPTMPSPQGSQHRLEGWGGSQFVGTAYGASLPSALVLTDQSPQAGHFLSSPGCKFWPFCGPHPAPPQLRGPSSVLTGETGDLSQAAGGRGTTALLPSASLGESKRCSHCLSRPSLGEGMFHVCVCQRVPVVCQQMCTDSG